MTARRRPAPPCPATPRPATPRRAPRHGAWNPLLHALAMLLALTLAGPGWAQEAADPAAEDAGPQLAAALVAPEIATDELTLRIVPLTKDELAALAAEWLGIVRAKTEEVVDAQLGARPAEDDAAGAPQEQAAARDRLTELTAERKRLFDNYAVVVNAWEKKGGDEAAIADYRAYRSSVIVEETRTADWRTLLAQAQAWTTAPDGGVRLAIDTGIVLGSVLGLLILARLIRRVARRWIRHVPNLSKLLQAFLVTVIYWLVMAFGLMIVLSGLGIDVSPVFALIGGASFILAFAFQDTLGNLASGLMIMVNRPFDEGDYVDVGGVSGTVRSVSIVATTVVTPDNQVIVIPNKAVWGGVITNVTTSPTRRVDLVFGISYEDSIADALRVMEQVVAAHPLVLEQPETVIKVHALADSSVNFICRPWVNGVDYWTVYWDLTRQMKEAFDAAGISIPYPQTDIHVKRLPEDRPGGPVSAPGDEARPRDPAAAQARGDDGVGG